MTYNNKNYVIGVYRMINQDYFINLAKERTGNAIQTVAVAAPHDLATLESLRNAVDLGFAKAILVGDENIITDVAKEGNLDISDRYFCNS